MKTSVKQQRLNNFDDPTTKNINKNNNINMISVDPSKNNIQQIAMATTMSEQTICEQQQQRRKKTQMTNQFFAKQQSQSQRQQQIRQQPYDEALTTTTRTEITTTVTTSMTGVTTRTAPSQQQQLDVVRYSMANAIDDMDLDTILSELLELEDQLNSAASDQLVYGLPVLPKVTNCISSQQSSRQPTLYEESPTSESDLQLATASNTTLNRMNSNGHLASIRHNANSQLDMCTSPDGDSAFGDSSSADGSSGSSSLGSVAGHHHQHHCAQLSSRNYSHSQLFFTTNSCTPSPTSKASFESTPCSTDIIASSSHATASQVTSSLLPPVDAKTRKIREALEKMREAKMKKIYIKIFFEDNTAKGALIDERWTVRETMRQLTDRFGIVLTAEHAIVEECPDLYITRVYEDHEYTVENLEEWAADSKNKLHFRRVANQYNFIQRPQDYLLRPKAELASDGIAECDMEPIQWDQSAKDALIKRVLDDPVNGAVSELEGWLMLKVDSRKSWRRHYFVLRSSGLYYNPKCGKRNRGVKDLQCLMNVYNNQIYMGVGWKKKYKAPSEFGFAIKHPRIQVKTSKYIKYICAEDEISLDQWIAALRIVKNGFKTLHENYLNANYQKSKSTHSSAQSLRVDVPDLSATTSLSVSTPSGSMSQMNSVQSRTQLRNPLSSEMISPNCSYTSSEVSRSDTTTTLPRRPPPQQSSLNYFPVNGVIENLVVAASNSSRECSPSGVFFDQDECGTIKRQPCGAPNLSDSRNFSPFGISRNDAISTATLPHSSQIRLANGGQEDDKDSDEEDFDDDQLPPPPACTATLTPTISDTFTPRKVPPPPPKRSANTTPRTTVIQLQKEPQVNDLYAELQKATERQKRKIEQSS